MSRITIIRTAEEFPPETVLAHVRRFLFGLFDGWQKDDRRGWRKLWKRLSSMECGEFAVIEFVMPRSTPYHRRHMAIEAAVFDAQERFNDFDMFRDWLKIGAAWVLWVPGAKGGIVPLPRSVSYAKADQAEFEAFHRAVIGFLRAPHAAPYLWKHLGDQSHEMMDSILNGFDE
ncbi:MAG: DUF1367 family protein [Rhodocyclaceae bacterium]